MAINWATIETNAETAVKSVLGNAWTTVSAGATGQIQALISVGQSIEAGISAHPPTISQSDSQALILSSQRALDGVLQTYEAIGIVVAEQAAEAAINVVVSALKTAYPVVGMLI